MSGGEFVQCLVVSLCAVSGGLCAVFDGEFICSV